MQLWTLLAAASAPLALVQGHSVILNAQGLTSSPPSVGFQVIPELARNCITINPCQQDATLIRDAEIKANIANECGRTEIGGNIDIGESTEKAIAANAVTEIKPGSEVVVTLHQVNADGAGPYECDLEEDGNTGTKFTKLAVTNNVPGVNGFSLAKAQAFNITVRMPDQLNCIGASTGDVCTVRCRNNALAGPFGGCFPARQVGKGNSTNNTPANIQTKQKLEDILEQVRQNQADLDKSRKAQANASSIESQKNRKEIDALLGEALATKIFPTQTPVPVPAGSGEERQPQGPGNGKEGSPSRNPTSPGNGNESGPGRSPTSPGGTDNRTPPSQGKPGSSGTDKENSTTGGKNGDKQETGTSPSGKPNGQGTGETTGTGPSGRPGGQETETSTGGRGGNKGGEETTGTGTSGGTNGQGPGETTGTSPSGRPNGQETETSGRGGNRGGDESNSPQGVPGNSGQGTTNQGTSTGGPTDRTGQSSGQGTIDQEAGTTGGRSGSRGGFGASKLSRRRVPAKAVDTFSAGPAARRRDMTARPLRA